MIEGVGLGDDDVMDRRAFGDRGNREAGRLAGRQVLVAVDCDVDVARQQRRFDLLGEEALALYLVERQMLDGIALRLDDDDLGTARQA